MAQYLEELTILSKLKKHGIERKGMKIITNSLRLNCTKSELCVLSRTIRFCPAILLLSKYLLDNTRMHLLSYRPT